MVETLNVGEEVVAIRSSVNVSEENIAACKTEVGSMPRKMEEGIPISIAVGRSAESMGI